MKSDIIVIGAGASGLMAAYGAAKELNAKGSCAQVTILEKMPRAARKLMITGKGRCNFTNVKEWNEFSAHIRAGSSFVKSAFYNLTPSKMIDFFEEHGMRTVVERGDRAFPESHRASEAVDTLVNACNALGVKIVYETTVTEVSLDENGFFTLRTYSEISGTVTWKCHKLIIATGGLSYPTTGSTGDGYEFAKALGHSLKTCFPSLTALVPKGYKDETLKGHIDRSEPLSPLGESLCGVSLKNIGLSLVLDGIETDSEFGDIDFTDGGIEGPLGFALSRKAVKSLVNGGHPELVLDMKPGISLTEITVRVKQLWEEIVKDPRSARVKDKERCRILLGKLMPWELIPGFMAMNTGILTLERRSRTETKLWVNLNSIAKALKEWRFKIAGYVGYERCVVTAGGISTDEFIQKTMESRLVSGLYLCGEVLDIDSDTGGYNLQTAFSTGFLAGENAAKTLL